MNELTLIQCTNAKRDETCRATELYDKSAYFRKMRGWAIHRGEPWAILSAKHGLVWPDDVVEPYDDKGVSKKLAESVAREIADDGFDTVHITAGRAYTNHLVPALESRGIDVVNHFAGLRIGERQRELQAAIDDASD